MENAAPGYFLRGFLSRSKEDGQDLMENSTSSEDVDSTAAHSNEGVRSITIEREVSEIEGWRRKLGTSGAPVSGTSPATSPS